MLHLPLLLTLALTPSSAITDQPTTTFARSLSAASAPDSPVSSPTLLLSLAGYAKPEALLAARAEARSGRALSPALLRLQAAAEAALARGPFSVMDKDQDPPSGDRHDYLSLGRYWWPNPDSPDGLPYIRRDGHVNPEVDTIPDKPQFLELISNVSTLSRAHFVFGDARYAEHAALLLKTWFLDPATRMNPNLEYSQIHKGHHDSIGGSGIIDGRDLGAIPAALALLESSPAWSSQDDAELRAWFDEYLDWLLKSPGGRETAGKRNNHRTFYWYQAIPIAHYVGRSDVADEALRTEVLAALDDQIEPDGSQPRELKRTKPFSYSVFNLIAFTRLADMARARGVDLWPHEGEDGRGSLRRAFEYLLPYARGERPVIDDPPTPDRMEDFARLLGSAAQALGEPSWLELARGILGEDADLLELDAVLAPPSR